MSFHEFNPFTGRLKESTKFEPYYPLKPSVLEKTEVPTMIWDTVKTKPVEMKPPSASYSSSVDHSMLQKFKHYQKDLSKPVYMLGGTKDKILFGTSILLLSICCYKGAEYIYTAAKKF